MRLLHRAWCARSTSAASRILVFTHPRLTENRQQHDPWPWREPVRDAYGFAVQLEAELTQLATQVPRVRDAGGLLGVADGPGNGQADGRASQ
jgi:hypothetical protein